MTELSVINCSFVSFTELLVLILQCCIVVVVVWVCVWTQPGSLSLFLFHSSEIKLISTVWKDRHTDTNRPSPLTPSLGCFPHSSIRLFTHQRRGETPTFPFPLITPLVSSYKSPRNSSHNASVLRTTGLLLMSSLKWTQKNSEYVTLAFLSCILKVHIFWVAEMGLKSVAEDEAAVVSGCLTFYIFTF